MIAFDTNVLIYACNKADPRRQQAAIEIMERTTDGAIPWQVACEFIAASRKLSPHGFTAQQAWITLSDFLNLFPLVLPTSHVLDRARLLHQPKTKSALPALIVAACLEAGVTVLYSEDLPSGRFDKLEIVNPFGRAG